MLVLSARQYRQVLIGQVAAVKPLAIYEETTRLRVRQILPIGAYIQLPGAILVKLLSIPSDERAELGLQVPYGTVIGSGNDDALRLRSAVRSEHSMQLSTAQEVWVGDRVRLKPLIIYRRRVRVGVDFLAAAGDTVQLCGGVAIRVLKIADATVWFGFDAPAHVTIDRAVIRDRKRLAAQAAGERVGSWRFSPDKHIWPRLEDLRRRQERACDL